MQNEVIFTREELYRLVWSEPLSVLASRYKMTELSFKRLCIQHSIPIPPSDYWNKVRSSQQHPQPPLPPTKNPENTITLTLHKNPEANPQKSIAQEQKKQATDKEEVPLTSEEPMVIEARESLMNKSKERWRNDLVWAGDKQLKIGVAPENIERACRFMNELITALKKKGHSLYISQGETFIKIGKQPLPILLREKTKRITKREPGNSYGTTDLVPSGVLTFHMTFRFKETEWKIGDGALADEAANIVTKLESTCVRVDEYQSKLEEGWEKMRREEELRKEHENRQQSELAGFRTLLSEALRWHQAQMIRDYLSTIEKQEIHDDHPLPIETANWLQWARAKADWYDPITEANDEWLSHIDRNSFVPQQNDKPQQSPIDWLSPISWFNNKKRFFKK